FVQIIGRGLRMPEPHPIFGPKSDCKILDHSDTHLRLGFVTDIHHDALDDGRGRQKQEARDRPVSLPKKCPSCAFLKPPKTPTCPACGFKPEKQSEIRCEEGNLVELRPDRARAKAEEKIALFGQLKLYGRRRGYAPGWAAHQFKEFTGVWPNRYQHAPEREPERRILSWLKSKQIASAKRRTA
ncbi:hypothetical protein, partial [Methylobacterium sp. R2-1]|uniref:hypothetical protein n=1 Tax=Methylobacterium sp. R2-1 TaxID=2587064 RepID=UPI001AEDD978